MAENCSKLGQVAIPAVARSMRKASASVHGGARPEPHERLLQLRVLERLGRRAYLLQQPRRPGRAALGHRRQRPLVVPASMPMPAMRGPSLGLAARFVAAAAAAAARAAATIAPTTTAGPAVAQHRLPSNPVYTTPFTHVYKECERGRGRGWTRG